MQSRVTVNRERLLDLLNELEADFDLDRWQVGGIPVWPVARSNIGRSAQERGAERSQRDAATRPVSQRTRYIRSAIGYLNASIKDRRHNDDGRGPRTAVFLGDGISRVRLDGSYYDRLVEPLVERVEALGHSWLHLEPSPEYLIPRNRPSRFIQPRVDWLWLTKRSEEDPFASRSDYQELVRRVEKEGIPVSQIAPAIIVRHCNVIRATADYFKNFLERISAQIGFVVDWNPVSMAFTLACKESGILSVEIQHGVQDANHWAYSRWHNVPLEGYSNVPAVFWTWTKTDAEVIDDWASRTAGHHRAVVGGNPWLELWRGDNEVAARFDDFVRQHLDAGRPLAVLTLQSGFTEPRDLDAIRRAMEETSDELQWIVRLHPTMSASERSRASDVFGAAWTKLGSSGALQEVPLPALLRNAALHATHSSASVYEAVGLGVPSVVFGRRAEAFFHREIAEGAVVAAFDGDQLGRAIRNVVRSSSVRNRDREAQTDRVLRELLNDSLEPR